MLHADADILTLLALERETSGLWVSLPHQLMHWLRMSSVHQHTWYWLGKTDNMYCCSRVHFVYWGQTKSKIRFTMWTYLLQSWKQSSILRVNYLLDSLRLYWHHQHYDFQLLTQSESNFVSWSIQLYIYIYIYKWILSFFISLLF